MFYWIVNQKIKKQSVSFSRLQTTLCFFAVFQLRVYHKDILAHIIRLC